MVREEGKQKPGWFGLVFFGIYEIVGFTNWA